MAFCQFRGGLSELAETAAKRRHIWNKPPQIFVLLGPSGVGKTRWAWTHYGRYLYVLPSQHSAGTWFDNYEGQPVLLIDEFDATMPITVLLQLCDGYVFTPQRKGGFVTNLDFHVIIITSNCRSLEELWSRGRGAVLAAAARTSYALPTCEQIAALERRISDGGGKVFNLFPTDLLGNTAPSDTLPHNTPRPLETRLPSVPSSCVAWLEPGHLRATIARAGSAPALLERVLREPEDGGRRDDLLEPLRPAEPGLGGKDALPHGASPRLARVDDLPRPTL